MRKYWKGLLGVGLLAVSHLGWILDQFGRADMLRNLPVLNWILSPYFPPVAFIGCVVFIGWAYYDIAIHKEPAGFGLDVKKRHRIRRNIASVALAVIVMFVAIPAIYGYVRRHRNKIHEAAQPVEEAQKQESTDKDSRLEKKIVIPSESTPVIKPALPKKTATQKPKLPVREQQSGNNNTQTGPITQGPGSALSVNQTGGITAGTVNISPPQRQLTPEQQTEFAGALGQMPSGILVSVYCHVSDNEGCRYAQYIFDAFKKANWDVGRQVGQIISPAAAVDSEVYVVILNPDTPPAGLDQIFAAVTAAGIPPKGLREADLKPNEIQITIGKNPVH